MSDGRYLISSSQAKTKARELMELAGGKEALPYTRALEAVALGCGFQGWRELHTSITQREAGGRKNPASNQSFDDLHVDSATRAARFKLQLAAVMRCISCTATRGEKLVKLWNLSGPLQTGHQQTGHPFASPRFSKSNQTRQGRGLSEPPESPSSSDSPQPVVAVSYRKHRTISPQQGGGAEDPTKGEAPEE